MTPRKSKKTKQDPAAQAPPEPTEENIKATIIETTEENIEPEISVPYFSVNPAAPPTPPRPPRPPAA